MDIFAKKTYRWLTGTWKDAQHHLLPGPHPGCPAPAGWCSLGGWWPHSPAGWGFFPNHQLPHLPEFSLLSWRWSWRRVRFDPLHRWGEGGLGRRKVADEAWKPRSRLPRWSRVYESTHQCRGHGFNPWSGKIPHAEGFHMLGIPHARPMSHNYWSLHA